MRGWSVVVAGTMALSLACAAETDDDDTSIEDQTAAFRTAIEAQQTKYEQWEAAGQHDSIAALYTEDAVAAFGNQPVLNGRAALLANAAQMAGMGTPSLDLRTVSAMANGPLGVEYGTYVFNMTLAPSAPAAMAAMFPDSRELHGPLAPGGWAVEDRGGGGEQHEAAAGHGSHDGRAPAVTDLQAVRRGTLPGFRARSRVVFRGFRPLKSPAGGRARSRRPRLNPMLDGVLNGR